MQARAYRAACLLAVATALVFAFVSAPVSSQPESSPVSREGLDEAVAGIDRAFEREWREAGLTPEPPADWRIVVRRLSLALTGTVPSLAEIRRLEALPRARRIDAHLDHLMADRRFADYWAERLARAYVGVDQGPFLVYRRRRFLYWLSDAIAHDWPYDRIVRDLITSEGLWTDRPATNFVTAHDRDPTKLAARTARAFLGVRMDCAQCHDHPFAEWTQDDFEGLAAFFANIEQNVTGIRDLGGDYQIDEPGETVRTVEPRVPFAAGAFDEDAGRPREQLAAWIVHPDNEHFARAISHRAWVLMFGKGLAQAVDDVEADPLVPGVLEVLSSDFRTHGHSLRRLIRVIASTRAFRAQSAGPGEGALLQSARFAAFPSTPLRGEQIAGALVQVSQLRTVDAESHIVWRLMRHGSTNDFVRRYGDAGAEELTPGEGTIMQRLTMMNGRIVQERIDANLLSAGGRIAQLAPDDASRVDLAFEVTLTRLPTDAEREHFTPRFAGTEGRARAEIMSDLLWSLVNTTEFSWHH